MRWAQTAESKQIHGSCTVDMVTVCWSHTAGIDWSQIRIKQNENINGNGRNALFSPCFGSCDSNICARRMLNDCVGGAGGLVIFFMACLHLHSIRYVILLKSSLKDTRALCKERIRTINRCAVSVGSNFGQQNCVSQIVAIDLLSKCLNSQGYHRVQRSPKFIGFRLVGVFWQ